MSDERKYRQRGYQDSDRDRAPKPQGPRPAPEPGAPAGARRISQDGPKNINTFECMQTIPSRVSPKNTRNACTLFLPRTTVERETTTPARAESNSAQKAFDDLFNF